MKNISKKLPKITKGISLNTSNVNKLVEAFQENPVRITSSFARLVNTYKCTEDEVREAKKIFKESLTENTHLENAVAALPENSVIERAWVNNKGKVSIQLRMEKEEPVIPEFVPKLMPIEITPDSNVLLVYLSDKHIGASVKDGMLGNEYNEEEFVFRMQRTLSEIIKLNSMYRFGKIIICDMGDAIDGQDGYTGSKSHKLPQNMDTREVYKVYMETHLDFFQTLKANITCSLEFRTVGESNHGGDLEWVLHTSLASHLEKSEIYCNVGNKFIEHFSIGSHTFLLSHGKDMKDMKFGLPFQLDQKTTLYIKAYLDAMKINSKYIHFIKGDLHRANSQYDTFFRYKNVLSLFGGSKWQQVNYMSCQKGVSMDILNLSTNTITEHYLFL